MRAILVPLSAAEEIALRQIGMGSVGVAPELVARLRELALVEPLGRKLQLTPLGRRRYSELPDAPLRGRSPSVIDDILNHYIPIAQAGALLKPEEAVDEYAGPALRGPTNQSPRILVVEDSYLEADALSRLLTGSGYDVVGPAGRLSEAMTLASGQALDGALLDVDLGGERSFDVAATLRRRSVPVAFISGYDRSIVPDSDELRSIPFVLKPFENEALVAVVKTFAS